MVLDAYKDLRACLTQSSKRNCNIKQCEIWKAIECDCFDSSPASVMMPGPKCLVYVSTSCNILKYAKEAYLTFLELSGTQLWKRSTDPRFDILVYCKNSLQKHPLSSGVVQARRQWCFSIFVPLVGSTKKHFHTPCMVQFWTTGMLLCPVQLDFESVYVCW